MPKRSNPLLVEPNALLKTKCRSISALVEHIKTNFFFQMDFDVKTKVPPGLLGDWSGYLNNKGTIGCLIAEEQGELKVCALADFKNKKQLILEPNADGFEDRLESGPLTDLKLYALRPDLIPGK